MKWQYNDGGREQAQYKGTTMIAQEMGQGAYMDIGLKEMI